jgi:alcohol dehydrogenase class IV
MVTDFFFYLNNRLHYGIGKTRNIQDILGANNYKKAILLVDEGVEKNNEYYREIHQIIFTSAEILSTIITRGTEEPDYTYLDEIAEKVRAIDKIDVVIAIGGGSCMDIAKAVAVLKTNKGKGIEYRGFDKVQNPGVDTILIPTTAGTGSEVTVNAAIIDKSEMRKLGINGKYMTATYAILDAKWIEGCPTSVLISSGADALTHAFESYMCKKATELTRILSKSAFKFVFSGLEKISKKEETLEDFQQLLLGSYLAGAALFNSGSGIAAAFSYPLGVHFKIPHGLCGGIFLADVAAYNISKGYDEYAELLDIIDNNTNALTLLEKNVLFETKFRTLLYELGVPQYLNDYGVTLNDFGMLSELLLQMQSAFDQNPVYFSSDSDAKELLLKHIQEKAI